jgi:hypothetical protein
MKDKYYNWKERRALYIEDGHDYKEKIRIVYEKWQDNGFTEEWIEVLKDRWFPSSTINNFIRLLKSKRILSEIEYLEMEAAEIKDFERLLKDFKEFDMVCKAESEAFEKAGIDEGRVEYTCPICGGIAVANRYKFGGRFHGLGSFCPGCGVSHS